MENNLTNQINEPHEDSNQPTDAPPIAQPIIQPIPQPYIIQQFPQQYLILQPYSPQFFAQPYVIQPFVQPCITNPIIQQNEAPPASQTYTAQSKLDVFQPVAPINKNSHLLNKKLLCPKLSILIMFVFSLVDIFIHLKKYKKPIVGIINGIILLVVFYMIKKSAKNNDKKKYNKALCLYIICFILVCFAFIYCVLLKREPLRVRKLTFPMYIFEISIGLIVLSILNAYKKIFDSFPNLENQKLVTTQTV